MPIRVTSIQRGCVYDGPGVRTTVFLKGCYLSCPWCCNPETINYNEDLFFFNDGIMKCGESHICSKCELSGGNSSKLKCPFGVYKATYLDYCADDLFDCIQKDKNLFIESGGGVTFSGGEPLFQSNELKPLLVRLKDTGIHIAFETSLYAPYDKFIEIKDYVDYWLADVKFQFGFISNYGKDKYKDDFYRNLKIIQGEVPNRIKYRMVFSHQAVTHIPDIVDRFINANISKVEILPCHNLGVNKYLQLGLKQPKYTSPSDHDIDLLQNSLLVNNILSSVKRI